MTQRDRKWPPAKDLRAILKADELKAPSSTAFDESNLPPSRNTSAMAGTAASPVLATPPPTVAVRRSDNPSAGFLADLAGSEPAAIGLIESTSIAVGYVITDALVKKAPVRVLKAQTASPGKFFVLYCGSVAEVEEAHEAGLEAAGDALLDALFLPGVHPAILPALDGQVAPTALESFGVIETLSFAAAITATDTALKAAPVALLELRPPIDLGGKSFLTLSGRLDDLEYAIETALDRIRPGGMICRHAIIANPHDDLSPFVC